jgi:hypothetical protein
MTGEGGDLYRPSNDQFALPRRLDSDDDKILSPSIRGELPVGWHSSTLYDGNSKITVADKRRMKLQEWRE